MKKDLIIKFFHNEENWGDKISPILVEMISGKKPKLVPMKERFTGENGQHVYLTVGSVIEFVDSNTIVWGSGFIHNEDSLPEKPLKICAVRGPLTRDKILAQGFDCPEVYGDPVLLLPRYYKPKKLPKKKIGIIPHYIDQDSPWLEKVKNQKGAKTINIRGDYYKTIDEVCSCDLIVSSSLHGLILADAYGIPSVWVKLSDKLLGDDLKFYDYFASVGRKDKGPLRVDENTSLDEITNQNYSYKINIDLDLLYESCPFKK